MESNQANHHSIQSTSGAYTSIHYYKQTTTHLLLTYLYNTPPASRIIQMTLITQVSCAKSYTKSFSSSTIGNQRLPVQSINPQSVVNHRLIHITINQPNKLNQLAKQTNHPQTRRDSSNQGQLHRKSPGLAKLIQDLILQSLADAAIIRKTFKDRKGTTSDK